MSDADHRPEWLDPARLSQKGREILALHDHVSRRLAESRQAYEAMQKARAVHIAELKREIVAGKTGIDLGQLFDD